MDIVDKARQWCKTVRTKPAPLSEAIPMVAKLCDENDTLRNQLALAKEQLAECQKDVESYQLLKKNYVIANFNIYDDEDLSIGKSGVVIEMPNGIEYNADLDFIVAQAKAMTEKG
jgi:hypothetical protein